MCVDVLKMLLINTVVFSALFSIMLLLRKVLSKKMSAILQYALWAVVVIKLVLPFGFESALSPFSLLPSPDIPASMTKSVTSQAPVSQYLDTQYTGINTNETSNESADNETVRNIAPQAPQQSRTTTQSNAAWTPSWVELLLVVWIAGALAMALWLVLSKRHLEKCIRHEQLEVPHHVTTVFKECKDRLRIRSHIGIIMQTAIKVPIIAGVINPVLILPESTRYMREDEIRHVLVHELMHFKHGDLVVMLFMNVVNCLYWFNPLVWLCFKLMRRDMETICDQRCLELTDKQNGYVETVLRFASLPAGDTRLHAALSINDGRHNLEKRIRNMLKRRKSSMNTRLLTLFVAALMLVSCILTACEKTPDNPIIIGKDTTVANAVQYSKSDIPNKYQENYSKNGANIIFDADLEIPDSDSLPTYKINPTTFSQNQVDFIIKGLFGNQQMFAPAKATKADYEPAYLKALQDLKNKQDNPNQYENTLDYYKEQVNSLKKQIEDAPDTDTPVPIDNKLRKVSQETVFFSGRGNLGKDIMADLSITNTTNSPDVGNNSFLWFHNGNQYTDMSAVYPNLPDNGPSNLKITKEEAITKANDIISRIGADYMKYSECSTGILYSRNQQYPESFDPQRPQAYLVYFTRNENGVQVTYDLRGDTSGKTSDSYSIPTMYERIMVAVDDSGVTFINWQGLINIVSTLVKNNKIVPFADVMSLAKNQLSYSYATYENQQQSNENANNQAQPLSTANNGKIVSNEVHIQRITLGFMQIPTKNNDNESELVPVWDFFGYTQINYDSGAKEIHYGNNKSILTINALNGNVIDRTQGY